jgi:tRNA-Thr(GGU) m(6)t(6)A37 methyltransferase TsaA
VITKGELQFIGVVETAGDQGARVKIFPEFCAGLKGTAGFSHLILLYWMHMRDKAEERKTLLVFPKRHMVNVETGVFACRSPSRPNPIGLSIVELVRVDGCFLTVRGLDAAQGSPVIDIKPYLPCTDSVPEARVPEWTRHGPQTG